VPRPARSPFDDATAGVLADNGSIFAIGDAQGFAVIDIG
jgi:hypothetical protein